MCVCCVTERDAFRPPFFPFSKGNTNTAAITAILNPSFLRSRAFLLFSYAGNDSTSNKQALSSACTQEIEIYYFPRNKSSNLKGERWRETEEERRERKRARLGVVVVVAAVAPTVVLCALTNWFCPWRSGKQSFTIYLSFPLCFLFSSRRVFGL